MHKNLNKIHTVVSGSGQSGELSQKSASWSSAAPAASVNTARRTETRLRTRYTEIQTEGSGVILPCYKVNNYKLLKHGIEVAGNSWNNKITLDTHNSIRSGSTGDDAKNSCDDELQK